MLSIQGLVAGYPNVPVLGGVDIQVGAREAVAVVGPNGAGKTTLVRAIFGLNEVSAGRIMKAGVDITSLAPHHRADQGLAVVLENRNLFVELTVAENLALAFRSPGSRRRSKDKNAFTIEEIYRIFPVLQERADAQVELLSGGQQQQLAIARALLLQPEVLILDELTTGLAPKIVREILGVLTLLKDRGMSILIVEQSISLAAEITDRAYVMSLGRVVYHIDKGRWPEVIADETLIKSYLHG